MTGEEDADAGEEGDETSFEEILEAIDGDDDAQDRRAMHSSDVSESSTGDHPFEDLTAEITEGEVEEPTELDEFPTDDAGTATFDELLDRVRRRKEALESAKKGAAALQFPHVERGDAVLVVRTADQTSADAVCLSAFEFDHPAEHRVLFVSVAGGAPSRLDPFVGAHGMAVDELAHVHPGWDPVAGAESIRESVVDDPEDLTQLGIGVSRILADWAETGVRIDVCLNSLTALLQHASRRRVFRFMHLLIGRLGDVDAVAHIHIDADAHRPETVVLFEQIFDVVVRVGADDIEVVR